MSTQTVVDKRCHAAKEAFYGMGKAWKTSVTLRTKANVFKGQVVNTLLSGLEAETLRTCDFEKLEKCQMQLARKVFGNRGIHQSKDGGKWQHSNAKIRDILRLTNVHDELRIRRLRWIKDMQDHPDENVQLRAALGGKLQTKGLTIEGEYNPWMQQIAEDMRWYIDKLMQRGSVEDMSRGHEGHQLLRQWQDNEQLINILMKPRMKWFTHATMEPCAFRHTADPVLQGTTRRMNMGEVACEEVLEDGTVCPFAGRPADVGVHKYYAHGKCNPIKAIVLTNECPGCGEKN